MNIKTTANQIITVDYSKSLQAMIAADTAPESNVLTGYDEQHLITYLRLLDADRTGANWQEVAKIVLHIDPIREPDRARQAWVTHLERARWMTSVGHRHLLRGGAPH
jgi:hypothetical protein